MECAKYFHENSGEFLGAEISIRVSIGANSYDADDAYEDTIIENLRANNTDFQQEVDRVLDVDIVTVKKECILILLKARTLESTKQIPFKFFSIEFEEIIKFIFNLPENSDTLPAAVGINLQKKVKEDQTAEQKTYVDCLAENKYNTSETISIESFKGINANSTTHISRGFSIAVQPKKGQSGSTLRLNNLSENLVKAALTTVDKNGILRPNTEIEVTLNRLACKCRNDKTFEFRPLSSQRSYGRGTGQRFPLYNYIFEELDFLEVGRITGIIKGNAGLSAAAIRAGHNYVLTTFHFVSAADPEQIVVVFKYEGKSHKLRHVFSSQELDITLLEIQTPSEPINSFLYITDASPGDDLYIVGHSSKYNLKKERTTCLNWRNLDLSADCKDYIFFHSEKFGAGSSGSPCLKIHENKLCVASIVIGELLGRENKGTVHLGVNMVTFYHQFYQEHPDLCQTIFKIIDTDSIFCRYCGTYNRYD